MEQQLCSNCKQLFLAQKKKERKQPVTIQDDIDKSSEINGASSEVKAKAAPKQSKSLLTRTGYKRYQSAINKRNRLVASKVKSKSDAEKQIIQSQIDDLAALISTMSMYEGKSEQDFINQ